MKINRVDSCFIVFIALLFKCLKSSLFGIFNSNGIVHCVKKRTLPRRNHCSSIVFVLDLLVLLVIVNAIPLMELYCVCWFPLLAIDALLCFIWWSGCRGESSIMRRVSCVGCIWIVVECWLCSIGYILLLLLVLDHYLSEVCAELILVVHSSCWYRFACLHHIVSSSRGYNSILA